MHLNGERKCWFKFSLHDKIHIWGFFQWQVDVRKTGQNGLMKLGICPGTEIAFSAHLYLKLAWNLRMQVLCYSFFTGKTQRDPEVVLVVEALCWSRSWAAERSSTANAPGSRNESRARVCAPKEGLERKARCCRREGKGATRGLSREPGTKRREGGCMCLCMCVRMYGKCQDQTAVATSRAYDPSCHNPGANTDSEEVASSNFHATIKYSIVTAQLNGTAWENWGL